MTNPSNDIVSLLLRYGQRDVIYEMMALSHINGHDETIKYIKSRSWKSGNDIILLQPTLKEYRKEILMDIEKLKRKVEITSDYQCRYCKSTQTIVVDYVARSADEPVLIKIVCRDCGKTTVIG
jgi:DNA-directed RNA polymerase subunit M/transcription elongation factor TFIIS